MPTHKQCNERFSELEIERFQRDGYVIAPQLADEELRQQMLRTARSHLDGPVPPVEFEADLNYPGAPASRRASGGGTVRRLKQAHSRDFAFTQWLCDARLTARLRQLLGRQVVMPLAHHNCIMTKQPQFSSQTHWHQDIRYWSFQRPELISVWLALGDEHPQNGCLKLIPGTHRMHCEASATTTSESMARAPEETNGNLTGGTFDESRRLRGVPGPHAPQGSTKVTGMVSGNALEEPRSGRLERWRFDNSLFLRLDLPENRELIERSVTAELEPGDVLFFHCRTFHAAGRNHTTEPKFSAVFTFRSADNPPVAGTRSASLPELLLPPDSA